MTLDFHGKGAVFSHILSNPPRGKHPQHVLHPVGVAVTHKFDPVISQKLRIQFLKLI